MRKLGPQDGNFAASSHTDCATVENLNEIGSRDSEGNDVKQGDDT